MEDEQIRMLKDVEADLKYIENELIAKQYKKDEETGEFRYVKFSRVLKCVAVINLTKKQYINYWTAQYKSYPKELKRILEKIDDKFENGLISPEEMIALVKESKDFESEKRNAIKALSKPKETETKENLNIEEMDADVREDGVTIRQE